MEEQKNINITWTEARTAYKIVWTPEKGFTTYYIAGERWYARLWRWIKFRLGAG